MRAQAEILGMPVGRAEQPEDDLRFEERSLICLRCIASIKLVNDRRNAWAAIRFVFAAGHDG